LIETGTFCGANPFFIEDEELACGLEALAVTLCRLTSANGKTLFASKSPLSSVASFNGNSAVSFEGASPGERAPHGEAPVGGRVEAFIASGITFWR
jgi:hypothetical protein